MNKKTLERLLRVFVDHARAITPPPVRSAITLELLFATLGGADVAPVERWEDGTPYRDIGGLRFEGVAALQAIESTLDELAADTDLGLSSRAAILGTIAAVLPGFLGDVPKRSLSRCAEVVLAKLATMQVVEWRVVRPIHGVSLSSPSVQLGPFLVCNWKHYLKALRQTKSKVKIPDSKRVWHAEPKFVAEVRLSARDAARALEVADTRFAVLDNVLAFMIANPTRFEASVLDRRGVEIRSHVVFSEETGGLGYGAQTHGSNTPVDLCDPHFVDATMGNAAVWSIVAKTTPSPWERKLLAAVEWIGKAINDRKPDDAFVQYVFALEALLVFQDKNTYVGPSIVHGISEIAAFVLGSTLEERIEVEASVKELYKIRSGIAHGGETVVTRAHLMRALVITKRLVHAFLRRPEFSTLSSPKHLQEWVQRQRYETPVPERRDAGARVREQGKKAERTEALDGAKPAHEEGESSES